MKQSIFCVLAVTTSAIVNDGLLFNYEFARSDCLNGAFPDVAPTAYLGNLLTNTSNCLEGVGVASGSSISSEHNIEALLDALKQNSTLSPGLSIEVWLARSDGDQDAANSVDPILAIEAREKTLRDSCRSTTGFSLSRASSEVSFAFSYLAESVIYGEVEYAKQCEELATRINFLQRGAALTHFVIAMDETIYFYVDGVLAQHYSYFPSKESILSAWNGTQVLQLFSNGHFNGVVAGLRMYAGKIESAQVSENFAAGLPNSPPVAKDVSVFMHEDGAKKQSEPEDYLKPVDVSLLTPIHLSIIDVDDQSDYPNFQLVHGSDNSTNWARAYISSLPASGWTLLQASGEEIVTSDLPKEIPRDQESKNYTVLLRPPSNEDNATASFSFYAIDGVTGIQSISIATVTVNLLPVNDPPTPTKNMKVYAAAGQNTKIVLNGSDIDSEWGSINAEVVSLPESRNATLHQVFRNGTISHHKIIAKNTQLWTLNVAYRYDGEVLQPRIDSVTGVFLEDVFEFILYDEDGAKSIIANITVLIHSPIQTIERSAVECMEEGYGGRDSNLVELLAVDVSDDALDVCIRLESTPNHGLIYDATTALIIRAGDILSARISAPYKIGAALWYVGESDFFSLPDQTWGSQLIKNATADELIFSAFACDIPSRVSLNTAQQINVRNVNDKPQLKAMQTSIKANPAGSLTVSGTSSDTVSLDTFELIDADRDVDAVRVTVRTNRIGTVGLDTDVIEMANFNSVALCFNIDQPWVCEGDGTPGVELTFVATPGDAHLILNGLLYQARTAANVKDIVTITIFDGYGQDCLVAHYSDSVRPTCYQVNTTIEVNVGDFEFSTLVGPSDSDGIPFRVAVGIFGFALFILVFTCIMARRCCVRKHKTVTISEDAEEHDHTEEPDYNGFFSAGTTMRSSSSSFLPF